MAGRPAVAVTAALRALPAADRRLQAAVGVASPGLS
jgi:hypothetical protein